MYTTVSALRDPWEAHMLCARLRAEGVPAVIAHEFHIAASWDLSQALGGVKVQVPADRLEDAQAIESSCRDGGYKAMLAGAFGDLDDVCCPHCSSKNLRKRRPFLRAAMAIVMSSFAGSVLPPAGWIYCCKDCDTEFRYALCPGTLGKWLKLALVSLCLTLMLFAAAFAFWLAFTTRAALFVFVAGLVIAARWASRHVLESEPDQNP